FLHGPRALDAQDVVRVHRTLGETVSSAHAVALVHTQVLTGSHFVQLRLAGIVDRELICSRSTTHRLHEDLALAALDVAEADNTIDLGDRGRILRLARLEQLGNSRQTARDVARLVRFAAELRQRFAGEDF